MTSAITSRAVRWTRSMLPLIWVPEAESVGTLMRYSGRRSCTQLQRILGPVCLDALDA